MKTIRWLQNDSGAQLQVLKDGEWVNVPVHDIRTRVEAPWWYKLTFKTI